MLSLGKINTLTISSFTKEGAIFESGDQKITMAAKEVDSTMQVGSALDVFVYKSDNDSYTATLKRPIAQVGEFGFLVVNDVNRAGAFADMGIDKELLIPYHEQGTLPMTGKKYITYIFLDSDNQRLCGSIDIVKQLDQTECDLKEGEEVEIIVYKYTDLGYNVIVNNLFSGLLYRNEVFRKLSIGETHKAYVKKVREDGKLDIVMQKSGGALVNSTEMMILAKLKEHGGTLPLSDNSTPREIAQQLQISKKTFKKAIGSLYKTRHIVLFDDRIELSKGGK